LSTSTTSTAKATLSPTTTYSPKAAKTKVERSTLAIPFSSPSALAEKVLAKEVETKRCSKLVQETTSAKLHLLRLSSSKAVMVAMIARRLHRHLVRRAVDGGTRLRVLLGGS
jgi:hypothetical protein